MDGSLAGINEDESELIALDFSRYEIDFDSLDILDKIIPITMIDLMIFDIFTKKVDMALSSSGPGQEVFIL